MVTPDTLLPPDLPKGKDILAKGQALAKDWKVASNPFLEQTRCPSEAAYKRRCMEQGRIMQHAQIGFRDLGKSRRAWTEIYESCERQGVRVDRYGICLDWTMGLPRDLRDEKWRGTGLILDSPEDFASLVEGAPVAPHFGDFVLGFPAAVENTQVALSAGSTSIGNLGQYFTFRLPGYEDDLVATEATLTALGLIAAQEVEILVHSNLDDGFAALFTDLASSLGAVLLEKYIVEDLIGGTLSHCFGHHFSNPKNRLSFHLALSSISDNPGTMVYGNTTSYQGTPAQNYASLATYLSADIIAQHEAPSGHAINPVPVTENQRIPDIDEIIDAQLFAGRLIELDDQWSSIVDMEQARNEARKILDGGKMFFDNILRGLMNSGVDTNDPFQMLLTLRRMGGRRLEDLYGAGEPLVASSLVAETNRAVKKHLSRISGTDHSQLSKSGLRIMVAATDVHEHGKMLVERLLEDLSLHIIDGGVSIDPDTLADRAAAECPDALAISTYNGIALTYVQALKEALAFRNIDIPVLIGGRLNQVPPGSNSSLPFDVGEELTALGATICQQVEDAIPPLLAISKKAKRILK